jgi:hypothetical protein
MTRPTTLQAALDLSDCFPRPVLQPPRFTGYSHIDPVTADKKAAAKAFKEWEAQLDPEDVVLYTDGSQVKPRDGPEGTGFGYAVFQGPNMVAEGCGKLDKAEVFDAEAEGSRHGMRAAVGYAKNFAEDNLLPPRIHVCIDNSAVL